MLNHMNGADPTDSILDEFERKELANYKKSSKNNAQLQRSINNYDDCVSDDDDNDVMGAYIPTTPKVKSYDSMYAIDVICMNFVLAFCRQRNRIDHLASARRLVVSVVAQSIHQCKYQLKYSNLLHSTAQIKY